MDCSQSFGKIGGIWGKVIVAKHKELENLADLLVYRILVKN